MADRPWLAVYPGGVPADIDPDRYASLAALIEAGFERWADAPAFSNLGKTLTFREVDETSARLAAYLQSLPGMKPGERVAVMLPNLLHTAVSIAAVLRAGLVVVNVNPLCTPRELRHQLADSGARAIIVLENFAHTVQQALEQTAVETVIVARVGDHLAWPKRTLVNLVVKHVKKMVPPWRIPGTVGYRDALEQGGAQRFQRPRIAARDVAFLQYTGGTTGRAKGAMLTHRNMVANVLQSAAWSAPFFDRKSGAVITPLPLYHIFSLTVNLLCFIELGGHNVLITNPRDLPAFVKELKRTRFTVITGVNTLFNALLNTPGFEQVDFDPLRIAMGGGMAVQRSVAERWRELTGKPIIQGYGLTEASPVVSANPLDMQDFNGSVGVPFPSTEVAILDEAGATVPVGELGEICVRGPQVMPGYWQQPGDAAEVFFPDGWLRTGDMGRMDEQGYIYIEDRKKDMIIVSGFNVYPNEIEDVVAAHPGVLEAAAIGVPDERTGEAVRLYVVRKDPNLNEQTLLAYCRENLTAYKVPRSVKFMQELPKTNVGKVLRRALRESDPAG